MYEGKQHGFHNDTTPRYDAEAAKLAWDRTRWNSLRRILSSREMFFCYSLI